MKKAVLFDLDGTMWDAVPRFLTVYNAVLTAHPAAGPLLTLEKLRSFMGKNRRELARAVFPLAEEGEQDRLIGICFEEEVRELALHHATPYPHLREVLEGLSREYTLAVVSNCQSGYIELFFDTMGVGEYFADHECADTGLSKGENIRLVLERNGIDRAVYLGDTQSDMEAADRAGIPFIHAAYGFGRPDRETPAIKDLSELPAMVSALLGE